MISLLNIMLSFGKIGLLALGGGNSLLKLIEYEVVDGRHWISHEEFITMVGSTFLFPGLTALKLSALIGYKLCGILGLLIAVAALNLPGLILATAGYTWISSQNTPIMQRLIVIVQYGGLALLAAATYSIAIDTIALRTSITLITSCLIFFIALAFFHLSPFWGLMAYIGICLLII